MHRHCWGHKAARMSLGRDTCCWTEEPLVISDEKGTTKFLSWTVVAPLILLLILKGAC